MAKEPRKATAFDSLGGKEVEQAQEVWRPVEPGEYIAGIVQSKKAPAGQDYEVATLRKPNGVLVAVILNAILRDLVRGEHVGEAIAIEYTGDKQTGQKSPLKMYRVKLLTDAAWIGLTEEADDLPL